MPKRSKATKKARRKFKHNRADYETQEYRDWVKAVKERDQNRCQFPGCTRHRFGMEIHHILRVHDHPELRYVVSNGICLCKACHAKVTGQESIYVLLFTTIVNQNTLKQLQW